jgi:hypothetical protein
MPPLPPDFPHQLVFSEVKSAVDESWIVIGSRCDRQNTGRPALEVRRSTAMRQPVDRHQSSRLYDVGASHNTLRLGRRELRTIFPDQS